MTSGPTRAVALPGSLAPLGYRNYALYWFGLASSNAGRWVEQTGAVWLVYQMTDSPILLGLLGVMKALPTLLIAPFAGVIADRIDQRRLLFVTQGLALLLSLALGLLILSGTIQLWQIYAEILLTSVISAFDVSARQALFPRLIPRELLPAGVTLTSLASRSSAVIGPAVGGIVIATLGTAWAFLINSATFLVLMGALVAMRNVPPQAAVLKASFAGELREGMRYMRRTSILSGLLRLEIVFGAFQVNPVIVAIVGREVLNVGPEGLGGLLAAPALGAIGGLGCLLIFGHTRRPGRFVVLLQCLYSGALVLFALSTSYALSFILLAATGFLDVLETVTRLSIAQLAAPANMRGRVMSNMRTVTGGIGPLSQTLYGVMAALVGGPAALAVAAVALVTSATTSVRTNRPLWRFSIDDAMAEPEVIAAEEAVTTEFPPPDPGPDTR